MPVKGEKALNASKHTTAITTYTTGAPVSPAASSLAIYVDLAATDQHRIVEVYERLKDLMNRAMEENYRRPGSGTFYYYMPIDGARADITYTLVSTEIVEGNVAIGMSGNVKGGGRGSLIINACWKEIRDWMMEQERLTA